MPPPVHTRLALVATISAVALSGALASQVFFDAKPCGWCVVQRALVIGTGSAAMLAMIAARISRPLLRRIAIAGPLAAGCIQASLGAWAAHEQHQAIAGGTDCAISAASRFLARHDLASLSPYLFSVRASCQEGAFSILSVPMDTLSALAFLIMAALFCSATLASYRRRP